MAYYYSPFRSSYNKNSEQKNTSCPFCDTEKIQQQQIRSKKGDAVDNDSYTWLVNYFPKFEGHTMLVPKRHITNPSDETEQETTDRTRLQKTAMQVLTDLYKGAGIEIFLQWGPGSASSVPHIHWHILPALPDDLLRSFEKLGHFYTTNEHEKKELPFPIAIKRARADLQDDLSQLIP